MAEKTVEAWLSSPPDRDELVVELFAVDGPGFAEILRHDDRYWIDIYNGTGGSPLRFDALELSEVIASTTATLKKSCEGGVVPLGTKQRCQEPFPP